jgi:hypothetical protein
MRAQVMTLLKIDDLTLIFQLGDDSKVDEAIMISFFASLYDDITKAYRAFQEFHLERKTENLEKEKGVLQRKIDNINEFKEQGERINIYTALNIEKSSLEKKIKTLELNQKNNKDNGVVEITDQPDELLIAQNRLIKVIQDMDDIADFYGYDTNEDFMVKLESSEKLWYGETAAEHLQSLRKLDASKVENLVENLPSFSGNPEKVTALKDAFEDIQNYVEKNGMIFTSDFVNKAADFRASALDVQTSLTVNELAQDGARLMSERGEEIQINDITTKERSAEQELI